MSKELVRLPREVAEAIKAEVDRVSKDNMFQLIVTLKEEPLYNNSQVSALLLGNDDQKIIYKHFKGKLLQLATALNVGYEIEESKEDRVRKVISEFCNGAIVSEWVIEEIKKIYEG